MNGKLRIKKILEEKYDVRLIGEYSSLDFEQLESEFQAEVVLKMVEYLKENDSEAYSKVIDVIVSDVTDKPPDKPDELDIGEVVNKHDDEAQIFWSSHLVELNNVCVSLNKYLKAKKPDHLSEKDWAEQVEDCVADLECTIDDTIDKHIKLWMERNN